MSAMDKIKNMMQGSKGKTKKVTGRATGDRSMEAEGKGDQVAGNLKQSGENIKDAFKK
ncbi:MAG: CsbD family protein [Acidimicrobiales bacterium]